MCPTSTEFEFLQCTSPLVVELVKIPDESDHDSAVLSLNPGNSTGSQHKILWGAVTALHPYPEKSSKGVLHRKFRRLAIVKPKAMPVLNR